MPRQSILQRMALVLFPVLVLCGALVPTSASFTNAPAAGTSPAAGTNPCATTTDAELVAAIQQKIKADNRFKDQWRHLNISSIARVVTVHGWAMGKVQVNDLLSFARTTKCVRKVVNKMSPHLTVGCAVGQKVCGDLCIDRNEQCNLLQDNGGTPQ